MPKVPYNPNVQVQPSIEAGTPYQTSGAATPEAFGADVGRAVSGLGGSVDKFSDVMANHAVKMQTEANRSAANDAFVSAEIEAGGQKEWFNSLKGKNATDNMPTYIKNLEKIREDHLSALPNTETKRLFDQDFKRRLGYMIIDAGSYSGAQNRQYNSGAAQARVVLETQNAVNAKSDAEFQTSLGSAHEAVVIQAGLNGWSAEQTEVAKRAATNDVISGHITMVAKSDPLRAREILAKNIHILDGLSQIKVKDSVDQSIINIQTRIESDKIIKSGALISDELRERVKKFEGYRADPYSDFKQTSSGYGTKAQAGDEKLSPEVRKKVHEQRLDDELGRAANIVDSFASGLPQGTREALISLTFNAGSSWTSSGLGAKIRAGDFEGAKASFLQYNQAGGAVNPGLVSRRSAEASWFGGEMPMLGEERFASMIDKAKEAAIRVFPDDPGNQAKYLDTLQSRIKADFGVLQTASKSAQLDLRNNVLAEVLTANNSVTSYEQLSPKAQQSFDLLPPERQAAVRRQMERNAVADVPMNLARSNTYNQAKGLAFSNKAAFANLDITSLDLPRKQTGELLLAQAKIKQVGQDEIHTNRALGFVKDLLVAGKVRPDKDNVGQTERYNQFVGAFSDAVSTWQKENKKLISEDEARKITGRLLVEQNPTTWNPLSWGASRRAFEVPEKEKADIIEKYKAYYGVEPRLDEIAKYYQQGLRNP